MRRFRVIFACACAIAIAVSASNDVAVGTEKQDKGGACTSHPDCDDGDLSTTDWCDALSGCAHRRIPSAPEALRGPNRLMDVVFLVHMPVGTSANCTRVKHSLRTVSAWLARMRGDPMRLDYAVSVVAFLRRPSGAPGKDALPGVTRTDVHFVVPPTSNFASAMEAVARAEETCGYTASVDTKPESLRDGIARSVRMLTAVANNSGEALPWCVPGTPLVAEGQFHFGNAGGGEGMSCLSFAVSPRNGSEFHIVLFPENVITRAVAEESVPSEKAIAAAASSVAEHARNIIAVHVVAFDSDADGAAVAATFGRPDCDKAYEDGRGMNRADTLAALKRTEKKHSLKASVQTRVLTGGRFMRVLNGNRLVGDEEYLNNTRPGFDMYLLSARAWDPLGRRPPTRQCAQQRTEGAPHSAGTEGAPSSSSSPHSHIRTETKMPGRQWSKDHIVAGHVPILEWDPLRAFSTVIAAGRRPVVLRNASPSQWPAIRKWADFDYLADNVAKSIVCRSADRGGDDTSAVAAAIPPEHPSVAVLEDVKVGTDGRFFDPDRNSVIALALAADGRGFAAGRSAAKNYALRNMTVAAFFGHLRDEVTRGIRSEALGGSGEDGGVGDEGAGSAPPREMYAHFARLEGSLLADVRERDHMLFLEEEDYDAHMQFAWLSSAGVRTHTHFDQDHNFFVQIFGRKRFTLFMPSEYPNMRIFPRLHPMWHKSQVDFAHPDLDAFPEYQHVLAWEADLGPGDVLYVPPYTWHHVESLTTSISLSTWSHDTKLYENMQSLYRYEHNFDNWINDPVGKTFALRLYLDLLIVELLGPAQTAPFFERLLATRYGNGIDCLLPFDPEKDITICLSPHNETLVAELNQRLRQLRENGVAPADFERDEGVWELLRAAKIPAAQHVVGFANLDMRAMSTHFYELKDPVVQSILFENYVEELIASIVGVRKTYAFMRFCFVGQAYYYTEPGSEEHAMWE